jgi:shikimate 5-dehydrogenase
MQPHEIKPDTKLCTILGYNAQTGNCRRYFNGFLKQNGLNATAIALNIKEEHFIFTMENLPYSKVDRMILEHEFQDKAMAYCSEINECAKVTGYVDFIEVIDGKIVGYCLDDEVDTLAKNPNFLDARARLAIKMMILSNRWYGATIDMDMIPTMI